MNGRNPTCNPQEDSQQLYEQLAWRNRRADQAEAVNFDDWLDSPEGQEWLNGKAEEDRYQRNGYNDYEAWDYAALPVMH